MMREAILGSILGGDFFDELKGGFNSVSLS